MEILVLETGGLPVGTVLSISAGSIRKQVSVEANKAISLPSISSCDPVRLEVMSQVGTKSFELVPGQDIYDVPITPGAGGGFQEEVALKLKIEEVIGKQSDAKDAPYVAKKKPAAKGAVGFEASTNLPAKKLQTALTMRSYLDSHDVLRRMQDLLHDVVTRRPEDPVGFMIHRLEEVCQGHKPVEAPELEEAETRADHAAQEDEGSESSSDDDDDTVPEPERAPAAQRKRAGSVSEEAYGQFNQRKAYVPKVVPKSDLQKSRLQAVMRQCWMFQSHTEEHLSTVIDAMEEKLVPAGVRLISRGDAGDAMWVIEKGMLECYKDVQGEEKLVKTCRPNDVFGELALLYGCPRAASVVSKEPCTLWELDRETFKAICYESARKDVPDYVGFSAVDAWVSAGAVPKPPPSDPPPKRPSLAGRRRREGVSAEATSGGGESWTPPVHAKSQEEKQQLSDIIRTSHDSKLHVLFGIVTKETLEKIVDAMSLKPIGQGEPVIEQGGVGDFFYIVKKGAFDIQVQRGEDPPKKVFEAGVGFAFGELALLYNAPRSATVTAMEESEVWCLDRAAFRNLVVRSAEARFKQHLVFLEGVEVFHVLTQGERAALAEVLEEESFEDDEAIVEQGEHDDKMFILRSGQAVACIRGEEGEVEVMQYSVGDYFGEIALLSGEPRKASVYAVGSCSCLYISRPTFLRVLGPLQSLLERNIGKYEKYADAIQAAKDEQGSPDLVSPPLSHRLSDAGRAPEDEEFDGSVALPGTIKHKVVSRKRERASVQERLDRMKSEHRAIAEPLADKKEQGMPKEAETLAEKVAQDLRNPVLVVPCDSYAPPAGCTLSLHAGLRLGTNFADNSSLHVLGSATAVPLGEGEALYSWHSATKLKAATEIGVTCQKGQKMFDGKPDPTPNQDNCFVRTAGAITLYGVCDGHGPFGHLVSFRLSQTLPHFITTSSNWGKNWELTFKEAFSSAQEELVAFASVQGINIEASGAAASVLLLEEQTVHLAFVGDSRIMIGSWNRHDSRMIFATQDHKPDLPEEKARLEAAGSEVREVDPGSHRVYKQGSNFPGLTMSRTFGDTACAGVVQEPEYHQLLLQPTDQWYAVLASDGVWEFMESEEVCGFTAKKLRLKGPRETLNSLVNASRKRWSYCCGDYCDDVTAILVQWNAPETGEPKANHSVAVRCPS